MKYLDNNNKNTYLYVYEDEEWDEECKPLHYEFDDYFSFISHSSQQNSSKFILFGVRFHGTP